MCSKKPLECFGCPWLYTPQGPEIDYRNVVGLMTRALMSSALRHLLGNTLHKNLLLLLLIRKTKFLAVSLGHFDPKIGHDGT